jgi:hypothetical protein
VNMLIAFEFRERRLFPRRDEGLSVSQEGKFPLELVLGLGDFITNYSTLQRLMLGISVRGS